jgi:accessory colonization factor AcfC
MTVIEILQSVQFVVNQEGDPTAAVLDIKVWEAILSMLEDAEDIQIIRNRVQNWRIKEGWTAWEDFEAELDADALPTVD